LKILLASTAMGLGVIGLKQVLAPLFAGGIPLQLVGVFTVIACAALLYGVVLHLLKLPEFDEITGKIRQRFRK
ncbi:MAG: murein biosynthesis integral membrane protein MurJ, partial [Candidatus Electrothrix sp. AUS1_2]|nr:murein biosynthesis integral membrane protein MurJ [Candidatus Electrothrix sp. AUS1_2]